MTKTKIGYLKDGLAVSYTEDDIGERLAYNFLGQVMQVGTVESQEVQISCDHGRTVITLDWGRIQAIATFAHYHGIKPLELQ